MDWSTRSVLVTGAGGFIGSHLAERLVELGAKTRVLVHYRSDGGWGFLDGSPVREELQVVAGDVCDPESLTPAFDGVDVVFHLAALIGIPYSYNAPRSYVRTNVEGTLNVLEQARRVGVERLVHTSTSEVYGTARFVPITEAHPLQGQSPYSASKIGGDKLAEAYHRSFGLPVTTVRPFNTFGPRQSTRAVIPTIITQALAGPEILLGSLTPTRDFTYVKDTVEGFVMAAAAPDAVGEVMNLGTGNEISIGDLAAKILSVVGEDRPVRLDPKRVRPSGSEVDRLCASNEAAKKLAGWEPRWTLEKGLEETVRWLRDNRGRRSPDAYAV